eukprot:symbB.v1.2.017755.t1/scaffold1389.1/size122275/4
MERRILLEHTATVKSCASLVQWKQCLDILQQLKEEEQSPDVILLTSIVTACGRATEGSHAVDVFEELKRYRIEATVISYSAVINACSKCSDWWRALSYFDDAWDTMGDSTSKEAVSFLTTASISACGRAVQWLIALEILEEVSKRSMESTSIFAQNAAISSNHQAKPLPEWIQALELFGHANDSDVVTYTSVISACQKVARWQEAIELFVTMEKQMRPDLVCFGAVISALEKVGQWEKAFEFFRMLESQDVSLLPNLIIFNALMSACEKAGQWQRALHLLDLLKSTTTDVTAYDVVTYNALISACEKGQQWRKALEVLEEARSLLKIDVISGNAVLSACAAASRWVQSLQFLEVLLCNKLLLDLIGRTAIISSCAKVRGWQKALQFLGSCAATEVTYNAALSSMEGTVRWKESLEVVAAMRQCKMSPNILNYGIAIGACDEAMASPFHSTKWKLFIAAGVGAVCGFCLARRSPRGDGDEEEKNSILLGYCQHHPTKRGCGALHAASTMKERTGGRKMMPKEAPNGRREVICEDALEWIEKQGHFPSGSMVFTSLPDMSEVVEFAPRFEDWEDFFMKAVRHILTALPYGSVAAFYQTDVRLPTEGQVSKAFLVLKAAEAVPEARGFGGGCVKV